ncbi:hypothetical protein OsJ_32979 [Oryza sativa Japonica Group]|uniref:RING-type domain-containing protein n=1 Tax=Oryza sativa subsp. japonica TaxID=39947 RepID=A3C8N9_ORYSJ|nr:hypothetical protein OsJ_32979 [Oryza sativa Japonica Group]
MATATAFDNLVTLLEAYQRLGDSDDDDGDGGIDRPAAAANGDGGDGEGDGEEEDSDALSQYASFLLGNGDNGGGSGQGGAEHGEVRNGDDDDGGGFAMGAVESHSYEDTIIAPPMATDKPFSSKGLASYYGAYRANAAGGANGGGAPRSGRQRPASAAAVAALEKRKHGCGGGGGAAAQCVICIEDYEVGDDISVMPCSYGHSFHHACLADWLARSRFCPLCRHKLPAADDDDQDDAPDGQAP